MIKEYKVCTDISLEHITDTVNHHIKEGWQPLGGIAVVHTDISDDSPPGGPKEGIVYLQAVGR
jgi:hypothetical protein